MPETDLRQSVQHRATSLGRWLPVCFYCLIVIPWFINGVLANAGYRLALVLLALPALVAYLIRTARHHLEPGFHFAPDHRGVVRPRSRRVYRLAF
jgi:hypothetical protein